MSTKYNDKPTELNYPAWLEANARRLASKKTTSAGASLFYRRVGKQLKDAGMGILERNAMQQISDLEYIYRNAKASR